MEDNPRDINPFASPQAEIEEEKSELFCLTVYDAVRREWSQIAVATLLSLILVALLVFVTMNIHTPQPLYVVVLLWLTGIFALGAMLKGAYHWTGLSRLPKYLPIRLTVDGIEARCELNGRFREINWPWHKVAKLRLIGKRWLEIHAKSGEVAVCYLCNLNRAEHQALRQATRSLRDL